MAKDSKNTFSSFNLSKYITLCFKSWKVFVISVCVCVFLAGVLTILRPPKDEVFAQLMLKEDVGGSSLMMAGQIARSFSLGDMFGGSSTTDNEAFVLKSHTVFRNTSEQMGLNTMYFNRPFGVLSRQMTSKVPYTLIAPPLMCDTLSRTLVFDIKKLDNGKFNVRAKVKRQTLAKLSEQSMPVTVETSYGTFVINTTEWFDAETTSRKFRIKYCSYDAAASMYEELVNIYVPDRKSDFIDLSFATTDAAFGKSLLNHIIDNYIDLSNVHKTDRSTETLRLVDDRLNSLASELITSEHAIEDFKKNNKLTDVEVDAQYLMTKTGALESSLLEAQTSYELVKMTRDFITNPENSYSLIPDLFMSSGVMSGDGASLIAQYNQLILERMELTGSAKGNNSTVKQLDQQIDALRANILTSVDRMYQNASVTLRDLKEENNKNKLRINELPTIERQYIVLKRDNLLQEQIYLFLLQQREELNMSLGSRTLPAQVIDAPYVLPYPAGLTRMMTLALGVILGLIAGAAYIFFVKLRKYPITSRKEVDSLLKAPVLQSLSADEATSTVVSPQSVNAETIRHLRADVINALEQCNGNVAVVTSLHNGEGKTYVAVNLATSLALTGKRVVLVDTALRTPGAAKMLNVNNDKHLLSDYVYNDAELHPSSVSIGNANIDVIASTASDANGGDIVASTRFADLIHSLSGQYDYVVLDASSIDGYSDIYALTALADVTLVVCRSKYVNADDIERINSLYDEGRLKRIAVVENGFK